MIDCIWKIFSLSETCARLAERIGSMKKAKEKNTNKKIDWSHIKTPLVVSGIIALFVVSLIFLGVAYFKSSQANDIMVAGVRFEGEYRIGEGEWQPIVEGEHIPASKGDIYLRGAFRMIAPDTNKPLKLLSAGTTVYLYFNHLSGSAVDPSGNTRRFDAEHEMIGEDACAAMWSGYTVPQPNEQDGSSEVLFVLHNPHSYGNENAVDDFLEYMSIAPASLLEKQMLEKGEQERTVGLVIAISSVIVLGIAAFSTIIHIKYSKEIWLIGLVTFFAGGYFLFDAFAVSMWSSPNIVNTRALGLFMMFYMFFIIALSVTTLRNTQKQIATVTLIATAGVMLFCILVSFSDKVKFYDTWGLWAALESGAVAVIIACLLSSLKNASLPLKLSYIAGTVLLAVFPLDALATLLGWWEGGFGSKRLFIVFFVVALVMVLRVIPSHINSAIKAKQLEAEQQALRLELQESRISIMLSQMQPHFIFNTLNTIYHLCEINPDIARSTISSFSEYLRNNIDTLGQSDMIAFEKEFSFVRTYLDIEKVRFDDELEINFDIGVTSFKLPVLTVQPLVENAVKHGTSKKKGAAELYISTRETELFYEIVIRDTGVGFDPSDYTDDGHKHIGISSVKQRLANLCDGTLQIESELGKGTTATVRIPKKDGTENENISG